MITLFTCPKGFTNSHINVIQRNSIESWLDLPMEKEIILCGDEPGVKEICDEYGLIHVSDIDKNEYGTPYLNDVFDKAENTAKSSLMCYINCDIILNSDFAESIRTFTKCINNDIEFLGAGQRCLIDITKRISLEERIKIFSENVILDAKTAVDYFVFRKGFYRNMPSFLVGRWAWDNWLIWNAISRNVIFVDLTSSIKILHQNHFYEQIGENGEVMTSKHDAENKSLEGKINYRLAGGLECCMCLEHARYYFKDGGIKEKTSLIILDGLNFLRSLSRINVLTQILFVPVSVVLNRLIRLSYRVTTREEFFRYAQRAIYITARVSSSCEKNNFDYGSKHGIAVEK